MMKIFLKGKIQLDSQPPLTVEAPCKRQKCVTGREVNSCSGKVIFLSRENFEVS